MTKANIPYSFLLGILSVWRVTHLLHAEDGPWDSVVRLRRCAGAGFWGQLLDCFYCLSVWVAAPLAIFLGRRPSERFLLWTALSAGAIMLESFREPGHGELPAFVIEDSEDGDGMLW